MTLEELKDYFKNLCLSHKNIKEFYVGNDYNQAEKITHKYPMVFYELPYYIDYNLNPQRQVDEVQVAFNVFVESNWDKIEEDHEAISRAKEIGDAIITYIGVNATDFIVTRASALSVREFTDDSVAGMRFELTIQLPRTLCDQSNLNLIFY